MPELIDGVKVISLVVREDDRGFLTEIARTATDNEPHAVIGKFGQVYIVGDPVRGTIRAFHRHKEMEDWYFIARGSAKIVLVDGREHSETYKLTNVAVVSERSPWLLYIPPGVWHGWMSLEDNTLLVSIASEVYNREHPDEERCPADAFGDIWTVKGR